MNKFPNVSNGSPDDLNIPLTVIGKQEISSDFITILFEKPQGLVFDPGNWMDIRFLSAELSVGKTYSFASSPTEPDILIAFKKGVSTFKKELQKIQSGDTLLITQYGSNGFLLKHTYNALFIAGGIGITPFRSMIKEAVDRHSKTNITLLYLNHTDTFPFQEEFTAWQITTPTIKVIYVVTGVEGRYTKEKLQKLITNEPMCYIAGSPAMVKTYQNMLRGLGISDNEIKVDSFDGY